MGKNGRTRRRVETFWDSLGLPSTGAPAVQEFDNRAEGHEENEQSRVDDGREGKDDNCDFLHAVSRKSSRIIMVDNEGMVIRGAWREIAE
jgi:hypothetical protein